MKKIITVLAITLALSVLAGCGIVEKAVDKAVESAIEEAEAANERETEEEEETEETTEEEEETEETTEEPEETTTASEETTVPEETTTASEETTAGGNAPSGNATEGTADNSLLKKYTDSQAKILKSGKYTAKIKTGDGKDTLLIDMYVDGNNVSMRMAGVIEGQENDMTIIISNGYTYMLDNATKEGLKTASGDDTSISDVQDEASVDELADYTHTTEIATLDGKQYICETYTDEGDTIKCYFTEGVNDKIIMISDGTRIDMQITAGVPAGAFSVPSGYNVMEL